jgi:methylmalonyl-CoA/ethylmalonyl-CoA epimerase
VSDLALSHVGIAVPDLETAVARLSLLLGLPPGPVMENAAQRVRLVQFDLPNARIELLSPLGPEGPVAAFLARNPRGGLHHLALAAPDLDAALAALAAQGAEALAPPMPNVWGRRFAFLPPAAFVGTLLEVEEALPASAAPA